MQTAETSAVHPLDAADLSISAYRALREGNDATKKETPAPAPVEETPAADASAATGADDDAALDDETESTEEHSKEPKPKRDKISARFSELTGKIKALESELAAKRGTGRTEAPESKPAEAPKLSPDPNDPEPDASKFGDYVEWQKAWNRWDRRQDARQEQAARVASEKQAQAKAKADSWQSRVSEVKSELADFDEVALNKDLPVSPAMADAITDSELGPKILYHLGKHPDEAARIAKLPPVAQAREIGKLEAKLDSAAPASGETTEEPLTKKPPVSRAPAPIKPLGSNAATSSKPNLETMTQAEYRAYRASGKIR